MPEVFVSYEDYAFSEHFVVDLHQAHAEAWMDTTGVEDGWGYLNIYGDELWRTKFKR